MHYPVRFRQQLRQIHGYVRNKIALACNIQKRNYDRSSKVQLLNVGDDKLPHNPTKKKGTSPKLMIK